MFKAAARKLHSLKRDWSWKRSAMPLILCVVILFTQLPANLMSGVAEDVYYRPEKIHPIDASNSESDNRAWYNGFTTDIISGTSTLLPRYSDYSLSVADITAALGEQETPYIIETGLELADLAQLVNTGVDNFSGKYIRLVGSKYLSGQTTNVIDLIATGGLLYKSSATQTGWVPCDSNGNNLTGWTPIGNATYPFAGNMYSDSVIDVYNLSANLTSASVFGLFGTVSSMASISNIHLADMQIYSPSTAAGSVIGTLVGVSSAASINNCSVDVLATGARTQTANGTVINSSSDGGNSYSHTGYTVPDFSVYAAGNLPVIGGLIGSVINSGSISDIDVNISVTVSNGCNIGGIVGSVNGSGTVSLSGISGTINIASTDSGSMYHVGGVIGGITSAASVSITAVGTSATPLDFAITGRVLSGSGNDATVLGGIGGIVGYSCAGTLQVTSTYITATAKLDHKSGSSNKNVYFGGILGRCRSAETATLILSGCHVLNSKFVRNDNITSNYPVISVGGIVGGINSPMMAAGNKIENCTVTDTVLSCDGLAGGIVGLGVSSSGCNIALISGCDVNNLWIVQSVLQSVDGAYDIVGGICSATDSTTAIVDCNVSNSKMDFYLSSTVASYYMLGGIVGKAAGGSISSCISDIDINVVSDNAPGGSSVTGVFLGGVCGYASDISVTNTITVVQVSIPTQITNNAETPVRTVSANSGIQNIVAGGFAGYAYGGCTFTNCYSSGSIDAERPDGYTLGNRQSSIGGLVGVNNGSLTMSYCFTTASLNGLLEDSIGGLIGYNNSIATSVSNCHFGGTLLNPYAASIVNYSVGGSFTDCTYDQKWSPNAPSENTGVTATNSNGIPAAISGATALGTALSAISTDYYSACTSHSVAFSGNHVFAVSSATALGSNNSVTVSDSNTSNGITVVRRVKLIKNLIDTTEDGTATAFGIGGNTDLLNMQQYVAIGGGFLGSQFRVTASFTSGISTPIGMAQSDRRRAARDDQPFCGEFNGNNGSGYVVTLSASKSTAAFNGLFGYIQNASIHDLNVVYSGAVSIVSSSNGGGIVGFAAFSSIDDVNVKAVSGLTLSGSSSGGIVGYAMSTVINASDGSVSSFTGKLVGSSNVGGIAGLTDNSKPTFCINNQGGNNFAPLSALITFRYSLTSQSTISCAYVTGDIIGNVGGVAQTGTNASNTSVSVGGIVGNSCGGFQQLTKCYTFGNVTGGKYVGGLVGSMITGNTMAVSSSYMNGDVYANDYAGGLVGYVTLSYSNVIIAMSSYFVGQIFCEKSLGALTSSSANYLNFYYDIQVAGNLPVCANAEDDTNVEISSLSIMSAGLSQGSVIDDFSCSFMASEIVGLSATGTAAAGVYSLTKNSKTATVTLIKNNSNSWEYTHGTAASMTANGNDNRLASKNSGSNGSTSNAIEFKFTGNYFNLYDYTSGGHDAYRITIDGQLLDFSTSTYVSGYGSTTLNYYTNTCTANGQNALVTFVSNATHNYSYSVYLTSTGTSLAVNSIVNSLSITGLSYEEHTIIITGLMTKSNSYMNIRGFEYGYDDAYSGTGGGALSSDYSSVSGRYPQLTCFMSGAAQEASLKSSEWLYRFTENDLTESIDVTSSSFKLDSQVSTVSSASTYSCDTADSDLLSEFGISRSGTKYTAGTMSAGGEFNFTSSRSVGGYNLSIRERILVVPFLEGTGTETAPYAIRNVSELVLFRDFINDVYGGAGMFFALTMGDTSYDVGRNLVNGDFVYDLTDTAQNDSGRWNEPIGTASNPFQGVFDGNGKKISGMTITSLYGDTALSAGLFGYTNSASISSVTVDGSLDTTVNDSQNRDAYIGSIVANAVNTSVTDSYSVFDMDLVYRKVARVYGGAIGFLAGHSQASGILSEINADVSAYSGVSLTNDKIFLSGIVGLTAITENNQELAVDDCIVYGNINAEGIRATVGGIVGGFPTSNSYSATVTVSDSAFYGSAEVYSGTAGGIVGFANAISSWSIDVSGNISTAGLAAGNANGTGTYSIGGILGKSTSNATVFTLNGNMFAGEINTRNYSAESYAGGIFGYYGSEISNSSDNTFDSTKNPGLKNNGNSEKLSLFSVSSGNFPLTTAQLVDANGYYAAPGIGDTDFGRSANADTAEVIVNANSISLNIVRVDNAYAIDEGDSYMSLTSSFILSSSDQVSLSKIDVLTVSDDYAVTAANKRFVSTSDDTNIISVQAVKLVSGIDAFGGYGKQLTYYPSVRSIGKTDTSFVAANPAGDSITGTGTSFTVYNSDQLAGLDGLVMNATSDGFGNAIPTPVSTAYTVYLASDIDYSGVDYDTADDSTRSLTIGDGTHPFTGSLNGQHHIIFGLQTSQSEENVGLFAKLSGAELSNVGITDSTFRITGNGAAGSFAAMAVNTDFSGCFSSARVEYGDPAAAALQPDGVYTGGLVGSISSGSFDDCFFTGSVGIVAVDNAGYVPVTGTGTFFSGGFAGEVTGSTTIESSYVVSYIHGVVFYSDAESQYLQNIGQFAGRGGEYLTLTSCSADYGAGSENCNAVGGTSSITATALSATDGLYPSKWGATYASARETAARIAASFSTSASSMSRVDITVGELSTDNYINAYTVFGTEVAPLYNASTLYATRDNSGIASILVKYTLDGITSSRMLVMNLQCWYDNFTYDDDGNKVYVLKNYEDLLELAQMVEDGSDLHVGHSHSVIHSGTGTASDRFKTATIQLGSNIAANGETLEMIGASAEKAFAGTFDGNGYSIVNANLVSNNGVAGMFGYITDDAVITNVLLTGNTQLTISSGETGSVYAGGIIAVYNAGTVNHCYNGSNMVVTNESSATVHFGGIAGMIDAGCTLEYCSNMAHITAVTDGMYIAGISGKSEGSIIRCYNTGIIDGSFDFVSASYIPHTVVAGICADNDGTVSQSYNAGIMRYSAANQLYPIADGSVSGCYADGRYLTLQYSFRDIADGYEYSDGTTILSTEEMSDGASFDTGWSGWSYVNGYYPQFSDFYSAVDPVGGSRKVYSTVSTLAPVLTGLAGGTATFDRFNSILFNYGDYAFSINQKEGYLALYSEEYNAGSCELTVLKRGASMISLDRVSGDIGFAREIYYINEEVFTVRYMFDFSLLTNDADESSARAYEVESDVVNTFANSATRGDYGTGTAGRPYLINTATDLQAFAAYINSSSTGGRDRYFKLVRDIDCSGISWTPIGTVTNPFGGKFNGNGYSVSGISSSGAAYNGLFGYANEYSEIKLVAIENSTFTANSESSSDTWTGAIAAYSDGVIASCYSRAIVWIPNGSGMGRIFAGGLVGELGSNGVLRGCYARPSVQNGIYVPDNCNNVVNYYTGSNLICGILAGKTSGSISGCYHTAVYYEPTGILNLASYGILVGWLNSGSISDTYYDSTVIPATARYLYTRYADTTVGALAAANNVYAKTTAQMKTTEGAASTDGVANDSMALLLSQNMYLGTYEMSALPSATFVNNYSNDGYPILTAFDLAQFSFTDFNSSNIILFMQNTDASEEKLMNALCTYDFFDFPTYADISAKERLNINVLSLPNSLSFNVSAVGYGANEDGEVKWTSVNGVYTDSRGLYENIYDVDGTTVLSTGSGSGMMSTLANDGAVSLLMNTESCLPDYCYKLYVYLTLKPSSIQKPNWGVYHTWDSSSLQELPDDVMLDD